MPPHQPLFEVALKKRGRLWKSSVCTAEGRFVMQGADSRRTSARYKANRALFLMLLSAAYSHVQPNGESRPAAILVAGHLPAGSPAQGFEEQVTLKQRPN